jgi:hypothetical protein
MHGDLKARGIPYSKVHLWRLEKQNKFQSGSQSAAAVTATSKPRSTSTSRPASRRATGTARPDREAFRRSDLDHEEGLDGVAIVELEKLGLLDRALRDFRDHPQRRQTLWISGNARRPQ